MLHAPAPRGWAWREQRQTEWASTQRKRARPVLPCCLINTGCALGPSGLALPCVDAHPVLALPPSLLHPSSLLLRPSLSLPCFLPPPAPPLSLPLKLPSSPTFLVREEVVAPTSACQHQRDREAARETAPPSLWQRRPLVSIREERGADGYVGEGGEREREREREGERDYRLPALARSTKRNHQQWLLERGGSARGGWVDRMAAPTPACQHRDASLLKHVSCCVTSQALVVLKRNSLVPARVGSCPDPASWCITSQACVVLPHFPCQHLAA